MTPSDPSIIKEAIRLHKSLKNVGWSEKDCELIAPITLEINRLKKERDFVILVHSYQSPDIVYGVADFVGDSYGLSIAAMQTSASNILFSSVHFMAETAQILNPDKKVYVPAVAGCSLADSITPEDVRVLRQKHPKAAVATYVNTSAAVKAESDVCVTSGNALKIISSLPHDEIIFIPDEFMAANLQAMTSKKIIGWKGRCIVHETFSPETVDEVRRLYPGVKILAHTECSPSVIEKVDMAGGTESMIRYIQSSPDEKFMLVTECGLVDRMKSEYPQKQMVGSCALCPFMKKIMLKDILSVLKNKPDDMRIQLNDSTLKKARQSLDLMIEMTQLNDHPTPQTKVSIVKNRKLSRGNTLNRTF